MAVLQVTMMSRCLMRTVPVTVVLPADKLTSPGAPERGEKPFKTLYLLHGVFGSHQDWLFGTRIQRYAEDHDLAVVMPSGDNAFYVDQPAGNNYYGEFIGRELVELTRKMFPLSRKREDTFIGGLSMGGYGALRNGLKYSETFGRVISLSGALHLEEIAARTDNSVPFLQSRAYAEFCFGDLSKLLTSDMNPRYLAEKAREAGKQLPRVYMACGDRDSLLPANRDCVRFFREQGMDVTFEVGPGGHEWNFWDTYIEKAIAWLPTEENQAGIHSGNVEG